MGIIAPSLYIENFKTTINNVYVAVGSTDVTLKTSKVHPHKGTWVSYQCGVWPDQDSKGKLPQPMTSISNTFPYDSNVNIMEQVYTNIKLKAPDSIDV